jgi:hypothetical protein
MRCSKCDTEFPSGISPIDLRKNPFVTMIGNKSGCPNCGTVNDLPSTERDSDFKFDELETSLLSTQYWQISPSSPGLNDIADAFVHNMHPVVGLGLLPRLLAITFVEAEERIPNPFSLIADVINQDKAAGAYQRTITISTPVNRLLERLPNEGTHIALERILSSVILGTWTAFEALTGDLWEAALNVRPDLFADLGGAPDRIQDEAQRRGCQVVSRRNKLGAAVDFAKKNSKTHVGPQGTHHRDNFVSFDSLMKMRAAYSCAFKVPSASIDDALCDQSTEALALVRNLLLHKAGIADDRYIKAAQSIPGCPQIGLRKHIPLRGDLVANLINPVIGVSMRLISAVDAEVLR